jgi:hypothetical protein
LIAAKAFAVKKEFSHLNAPAVSDRALLRAYRKQKNEPEGGIGNR